MERNMIFMYPMQGMLKKKNLYYWPSVESWRMNLDTSCASLTETVCLGEVGISDECRWCYTERQSRPLASGHTKSHGTVLCWHLWTFKCPIRFVADRDSLGVNLVFPDVSVVKNRPTNARNTGDVGSIPGSERCHKEGNADPLQYSYLRSPMDKKSWQGTVHGSQRVRHDFIEAFNIW